MFDLAEIQAAYYMVAATGVLVAAIYYVYNMRISQRNSKAALDTRQAQILMSLYQKWGEPEFQDTWFNMQEWEWRDYDDWQAKYGRTSNPEGYRKFLAMTAYFEGLGVFVKRGLIDPVLVDDMLSRYIVNLWQKLGPIYVEMRRRWSAPTVAEYVEYLYGVVHGIYLQQHPELKTLPQ